MKPSYEIDDHYRNFSNNSKTVEYVKLSYNPNINCSFYVIEVKSEGGISALLMVTL